MQLHFKVGENYLVIHTLSKVASGSGWSSKKYKKDLEAFSNRAYILSPNCYNLIVNHLSPVIFSDNKTYKALLESLPQYLNNLKKQPEYKKILKQTETYKNLCEKRWQKKFPKTLKIMEELTGLKFIYDFNVYITHPSLANGRSYPEDHAIVWGHNEDWPNYLVVYIWHEILHHYIKPSNSIHSEFTHSTIELLADNELRYRLNGTAYPPFLGHNFLDNNKSKIYPQWQIYLKSSNKNIFTFIKNISAK